MSYRSPFEDLFSEGVEEEQEATTSSGYESPFSNLFSDEGEYEAIRQQERSRNAPIELEEETQPGLLTNLMRGLAHRTSDEGRAENRAFIKGVYDRVKGLPKGIESALNAPRDIQKQTQDEEDVLQAEQELLDGLTARGVTDQNERRRALIEFRQQTGDIRNRLVERNERITDEDYAKEVGGTFFDVATLPFGATSVIKAGVKPGLSQIMRNVGTRGVEGSAFMAARGLSQGVEEEMTPERAKQLAIETALGFGFGSVFGGAEAGVKRVLAARAARKLAQQADEAADPFAGGTSSKVIPEEGLEISTPEATRTEVSTPDGRTIITDEQPKLPPPSPETTMAELEAGRIADTTDIMATTPIPEKPAVRLRKAIEEAGEEAELKYQATKDQRELADDILDGQTDNLKRMIAAQERSKTGLDATKIRGLDEVAEMLRERLGQLDLTVNDAIDYIKAVPTKSEINKLKPPRIRPTKPKTSQTAAPIEQASDKPVKPALQQRLDRLITKAKSLPDDGRPGSNAKRIGMETSAWKRAIEGNPTTIEYRNAQKYLSRNHSGKAVEVGGESATLTGKASFGRHEIKLSDGTTKFVEPKDIKASAPTREQVMAHIKTEGEKALLGRERIYGFDKQPIVGTPPSSTKTVSRSPKTESEQKTTAIAQIVTQPPKPKTGSTPPAKPIGTGKVKQSRLFQRLKDDIITVEGGDFDDPTYRTANFDKQVEAAAKKASEDFDGLVSALRGEKPMPREAQPNHYALAAANEAAERGNFGLSGELVTKASVSSTAKGQDIAALRNVGRETPVGAMMEVVRERTADALKRTKSGSVREMIKKETTQINKELASVAPKLNELQNFVNSLRC